MTTLARKDNPDNMLELRRGYANTVCSTNTVTIELADIVGRTHKVSTTTSGNDYHWLSPLHAFIALGEWPSRPETSAPPRETLSCAFSTKTDAIAALTRH